MKFYATAISIALITVLNSTVDVFAAAPPQSVTPLTAQDLSSLYGDKTWRWNSGGGRFSLKEMRFIAYTTEKGKSSIGVGRWTIDDNGKLCIFARWTSRDGGGPAATCFGHMRAGRVIFQRRHPDGKWYIFRHSKIRASDEVRKLTATDTVTAPAIRFQQSLRLKQKG